MASLLPSDPATPIPNAIINGTVIGPVVTPPESNARGKKYELPLAIARAVRANNIKYKNIKSIDNLTLNTIFIIANINNKATPTPTITIKVVEFITSLTCVANTVKSGSAIVTKSPTTNDTNNSSPSFLFLVSPFPTLLPIGVIDISAPILNSAIPNIIITDATKNIMVSANVNCIRGVKLSTITSKIIGATDNADSFNFK